jgi:diguanylate cyclase (GGDEF)-like protein/PAS domain S-box-containing protein
VDRNAQHVGTDRMSLHMLDAIAQAVVALDLTGCVIYWNAAAETCYGWSAHEALGRNAADLMAPDLTEAEAEAVFEHLLAGESWTRESSVQRRDGTRFPALLVDSGFYTEAGELVGIIGVTTDLTELKAAEQARQDTERRLQAVLDSEIAGRLEAAEAAAKLDARWKALVSQSADVALIADAVTTAITYVSPSVTRLFGWQPEALLGRPASSFVHPDDLARVADAYRAVKEDPDWHPTVDIRLACADGTYRWVEETISDLVDEPGVEGIVGNIRDITDRRAAEQALRRRDRVTRALAAKASDVAMVVSPNGRVRYSNPNASKVLVAAEGETLATVGFDHVHPDDRVTVRTTMAGLNEPGASACVRYRRRGIDGSWRWVEHIVTNCISDPEIGGLVVNLREITEQVEAEKALRSSESRYRLIAETAQEGILTSDLEGRTLYANQKMADLLGLSLPELYGKLPLELAPPELRPEISRRLGDRLTRGAECFELPLTRADGTLRVLRVSTSPLIDDGCHIGSLAMISDVTDARAAERDLQYRAFHDPLTGLANRALLLERTQKALDSRWSTPADSPAVLLADVDQFKLVNDSLGHASGDELLIEVARRWERVLRPEDTLARIGGDEFVVLCTAGDGDGSRVTAEKLRKALDEPIVLAGRPVAVSASIGIAVATAAGGNADELLGYADAAMYEAKGQGRGRVAMFTPCLVAQAQNRLRLFNDLKAAIEGNELQLHYQPVVELATGKLLGVEALCRWTHPERGIVAPDEFIPVAEESGLIEALDRWVLHRACRDGAAMRAEGLLSADGYVAVNSSACHLAQPGFETAVRSALLEANLPAGALVLEVTESAVMRDPDLAQVVLERLRELGVKVAIDDFGTGYSSLAYLRKFPVATLKIDRSFVNGITDRGDDRAIVMAIVDLARALGVATIAEGIETSAELELLQQLNCQAGQGFLWSPAISPDRLGELLRSLPGNRFPVRKPDALKHAPRNLPAARGAVDVSRATP